MVIRDHLHVFTVLSTEHSFPVFLFQGTRPGECPVLNPTPMCAGEITGCESDDGCSLGSRCCLQQDCTRKCVKAEIIPPPPPSKCSAAQANYVLDDYGIACKVEHRHSLFSMNVLLIRQFSSKWPGLKKLFTRNTFYLITSSTLKTTLSF